MRILQPGTQVAFLHRPFQGNTEGASLYASLPGDSTVIYRNRRIFDPDAQVVALGSAFPLGGANVKKTAAIASVSGPTAAFALTPPASWHNQTVVWNVRTHECDCENEAINGARAYSFDSSGNITAPILGTATLTLSQKRDGGGWLFRFNYLPSSDGLQPAQFALIRTSGPTSPATVTTPYASNQRSFTLQVSGLTNGGNYTFNIQAQNGSVTADLLSLAITADSAGPPSVIGLAAVEY
jgi:hypothetical protein